MLVNDFRGNLWPLEGLIEKISHNLVFERDLRQLVFEDIMKLVQVWSQGVDIGEVAKMVFERRFHGLLDPSIGKAINTFFFA